jgi:alpha-beta hydrolase superfamily lysophospholipase
LFVTADEIELFARHRDARGSPRASIVVTHGFTASADDEHVVALADALHDRDLDVTTYDARGHGRSGGVCTLGDLERHDVAAAVARARERDRSGRVVLVGASMGAISSLRYAAADDALAGLVTLSCPARWRLPRNPRAVLAALLTRTPAGRAVTSRYLGVTVARRWSDPPPPLALAPQVRAPFAILHGAADSFIPWADAHELYAAAGEPRRLDVVDGLGHAFGPLAVAPVVDAVEWALAPR